MRVENPMKTKLLLLSTVLAATLLASPLTFARQFEGFTFDEATKLGDQELKLNGVGLRGVLFIKGYAAGLYLSDKAGTGAAATSAKGPKRLHIRMLREASASDFQKSFINGMRKNSSETELAKLKDRIDEFEKTIEGIGSIKPGDTINLDFVPATGFTMSVNGAVKGKAIEGADFYNTLLEIFVGDKPVDNTLKKGLLGS
jgi:Chalcone isomerase-like